MSYTHERYDLVKMLKKINMDNDEASIVEFRSLLDSYITYIEAVVQHVVVDVDFRKYSADYDSRCNMEMYNRMRVSAHNEAIRRTLAFNRGLLRKHSMLFYEGCIDKASVQDFSGEERRKLGDFIFSTVSTCSTLTEKEIETIGMNLEDISTRKENIERGYRTTITENQDDIYNNLR